MRDLGELYETPSCGETQHWHYHHDVGVQSTMRLDESLVHLTLLVAASELERKNQGVAAPTYLAV